MLNTIPLTIKRLTLIELLEAAQARVAAEFADKIALAQDAIDTLVDLRQATIAYFAEITAGIADGRYELSTSGRLLVGSGPDGEEPPAKPTSTNARAKRAHLVSHLERITEAAAREDNLYETALTMLRAAIDDELQVPIGDYNRLLSATASTRW